MRSFLFLDVNVWLALTHTRHAHCKIAIQWLHSQDDAAIFFCRFTQLGLLRLLTNEKVMGVDVMTQRAAWRTYHRWLRDDRIDFHREPEGLEFESFFESFSAKPFHPSTKVWADAYLAAFAKAAGLTLVTFDTAFHHMSSLAPLILPLR